MMKKTYAIMRFTKAKDGGHITRIARHNFRTGKPMKGVDETRSHLNVNVGAQSSKELHAAVKGAIATATRTPRPDASKMVEFYCGASPEFFDGKTHDESKAYLDDCLDWARDTFGHENVIGAQYHFDETTPHIHIEVVPMANTIKKTKHTETAQRTLNSAHWMDGKAKMEGLQTSFAKFVQNRGHALERGEPKAERLAMGGNVRHKPLRQWYAEQIAEAKNVSAVAEEFLTNAAAEEKRAADARREAERTKERTQVESQMHAAAVAVAAMRLKRDGRALDKWLASERDKADARRAELDKRDADLRRRTEELDALTGGLASSAGAGVVKGWQGPDANQQRTLDFLNQNPQIAALLKEAQDNPLMADVLADIHKDMNGPGMHAVDESEDWSAKLRESERPQGSVRQGYGYS